MPVPLIGKQTKEITEANESVGVLTCAHLFLLSSKCTFSWLLLLKPLLMYDQLEIITYCIMWRNKICLEFESEKKWDIFKLKPGNIREWRTSN